MLGAITFDPPLSEGKRAVVSQGQVSRGVKRSGAAAGVIPTFIALAPPSVSPMTYAQSEYAVDGDSVIVAFGPDADRLSPTDREGVEAALRHCFPLSR